MKKLAIFITGVLLALFIFSKTNKNGQEKQKDSREGAGLFV